MLRLLLSLMLIWALGRSAQAATFNATGTQPTGHDCPGSITFDWDCNGASWISVFVNGSHSWCCAGCACNLTGEGHDVRPFQPGTYLVEALVDGWSPIYSTTIVIEAQPCPVPQLLPQGQVVPQRGCSDGEISVELIPTNECLVSPAGASFTLVGAGGVIATWGGGAGQFSHTFTGLPQGLCG